MSSNSFGHLFRITTFGESHGEAVGAVVDGCPAGLLITVEEVQRELDRRRPGTSDLVTARHEEDRVEILSGVFEGRTTGAPIALLIRNTNQQSSDYENLKNVYRPGHADFTYEAKYGVRDWRGGGRASARETVGRMAAGAIAKKLLAHAGIKITGAILQIGGVKLAKRVDPATLSETMVKKIETARKNKDSVGGVIEIVATGVPAGLGEPVFDKLSADLARAIMSIPAVKGFEIGDGFACASSLGSQNNDEWVKKGKRIGTATNHAGGIIGGISTGEPIVVRFALKPTSSIGQEQKTVDKKGKSTSLEISGRHDPCVCPRAVPVGEAMVALVIADHLLINRVRKTSEL